MGSESHNHPKATTLILGNPEHIAARMIDVFREAGYDGKFSSTVEGAIELAAAQHFDALIIGGVLHMPMRPEMTKNIVSGLGATVLERKLPSAARWSGSTLKGRCRTRW